MLPRAGRQLACILGFQAPCFLVVKVKWRTWVSGGLPNDIFASASFPEFLYFCFQNICKNHYIC